MTVKPVLLAVLAAITLTACDEPTAPKTFGASLARSGSEVELHYVTCPRKTPEKHIDVLRVVLRKGADPWDGDDPVLWEIQSNVDGSTIPESDEFSDVESFIVGERPDGFEEVQDLEAPLPRDQDLVAQIETNFSDIGLGFRVTELASDTVLNADADVPLAPDEFERQAADAICHPLQPIVPIPLLYGALAVIALAAFLIARARRGRSVRRPEGT